MNGLPRAPLWADDLNLWFTENSFIDHDDRLPHLWQAFWVEHDHPRQRHSWLGDPWLNEKQPTADGKWISSRAVGRFLCMRQLRSGPIRKLSDWEQLDVGHSILWHPEPDDMAIGLAEGRAARLRAQGRGHFDVQRRDDGTLWIGRVQSARSQPGEEGLL